MQTTMQTPIHPSQPTPHTSLADARAYLTHTFTLGQLTHMAAHHGVASLEELTELWVDPDKFRRKRPRSPRAERRMLIHLGRKLLRGWVIRAPVAETERIPRLSLDHSVTIRA